MKNIAKTIWSTFLRGFRWLFVSQSESKFGTFIRRAFITSIAIMLFALIALSIVCSYEYVRNKYATNKTENEEQYASDDIYISRNIYFHNPSDSMGYIYNYHTNEKLIEDVGLVAKPVDGDKLICFSTGIKRGYFNAYTGKIVIRPCYDKAWVFSDGLAAVQKGKDLFFINHKGKRAFKKSFEFSDNADGYCFHNGYCIIAVGDCHFGVINKKGEWAIPPIYVDLKRRLDDYWIVKNKDGYGLMKGFRKMILPCKYIYMDIDDFGILVQNKDYTMQRLNFDLTIKDKFVCEEIEPLLYSTPKLNKKGGHIMAVASCNSYSVGGRNNGYGYGLIDYKGRPLTKPIFSQIVALNKNVFLCKQEDNGILLNNHGEKINK